MWVTLVLIALIVLVATVLAMRASRIKDDGSGGWTHGRDAAWKFDVRAAPPMGDGGGITPTSIEFNGEEYASPEEMPPGPRAAYKLAMKGLLSDVNHDGVPDIVNLMGGGKLFKASMGQGPAAEAVSRVKELEKMRDEGLITEDEYNSKRAEIIEQIKKL
jgi:uncharacterized membrane protein